MCWRVPWSTADPIFSLNPGHLTVAFSPRPGWRIVTRWVDRGTCTTWRAPYAEAWLWLMYHKRVGPQWMEISDVHEAHECKIRWLAVSKITTNEIIAFTVLLVCSVASYDAWKGEGSWDCRDIGLARLQCSWAGGDVRKFTTSQISVYCYWDVLFPL